MTAVDVPVSIVGRSVYVRDASALVVADVHLGRTAASRVDAPIDDGSELHDRLAGLLDRVDPDTLVVAGDLLHSFDRVPRGVERELAALQTLVTDAGASLVVTPGNHDTMLSSVFDGETRAAYRLADGETVVCHGHEQPSVEARRYIVGHDHPAITIEGRKRPCFLYGPAVYEGADVLVLPAFTQAAVGATINGMRTRDFQSPLIADVDAFHPAVWDDSNKEALWFPPLGDCRKLL
ncbi:metallophosphoesterase [Natrialbaceae archaeon A-arb3/5]